MGFRKAGFGRSIRLRPDHSPRTGIARKDALTGLRRRVWIIEWNAANRDLEVCLHLLFHGAGAVPVGEREAAVDLRFFPVLRREEVVELLFGIDLAGIRVAELLSVAKEVLL